MHAKNTLLWAINRNCANKSVIRVQPSPTECSSKRVICEEQGNIVESSETSKRRNTESVVMVEKGKKTGQTEKMITYKYCKW